MYCDEHFCYFFSRPSFICLVKKIPVNWYHLAEIQEVFQTGSSKMFDV